MNVYKVAIVVILRLSVSSVITDIIELNHTLVKNAKMHAKIVILKMDSVTDVLTQHT